MSYQVTLNSRNVLVPIALSGRDGERLTGAIAKLDTATALLIQVSANGTFTQEFFPLKIDQLSSNAYLGEEWELIAQKTSQGLHVYYLGVPDSFFSEEVTKPAARSLSIQVVGTSPLTGRESFSGGEDIALQSQVVSPLIPGFLNLSELFFPTLLPQNFIANNTLDVFEFQDKRQLVLMTDLQMDAAARIPVSLEKHWEPNNWIHAVVENVAPNVYFTIRGGCFYTRSRKITHWFGGSIGLEEKNFRAAAMEKIRTMGGGENGAWVFWLEPHGSYALDPVVLSQVFNDVKQVKSGQDRRISVRHPILHRLLAHRNASTLSSPELISLSGLPARQSVAALSQMARILTDFQTDLQNARWEPAHAIWSQLPNSAAPQGGLEGAIKELYQTHGEILRALESLFEKTYGYSAWDAVGEPLRQTLVGYLAEMSREAHGVLGLEGLGQVGPQ